MKTAKNRVWLFESPLYLWLPNRKPRFLLYNDEGTIYEWFDSIIEVRDWVKLKGLSLERSTYYENYDSQW